MYIRVQRNILARLANDLCRGQAIRITYSERVAIALVIQHAKCMRRIMLSCVLSGCTIFFHTIS
jgi:hypothetical protein